MLHVFASIALAIVALAAGESVDLDGAGAEESCALQVAQAFAQSAKLGPLYPPAPTPEAGCKPVTTQPGFDLTSYISKRWYVQEQMVIAYLQPRWFYCVTAAYEQRDTPTSNGYTIKVMNSAQDENGTSKGGELCAFSADATDPAKLAVAPCFLPKFFAGPYWVLAYDETEGYALISGGQPTIKTEDGCRTGTEVNNAGLWIFTRAPIPPLALVRKVRGIAKAQGFDVSVLKKVQHEGCKGEGYD